MPVWYIVSDPVFVDEFAGFIMNIEAETKRVHDFVARGNYHAAYNIALSGLNACRRANDQARADLFIEILMGVVDLLGPGVGSPAR